MAAGEPPTDLDRHGPTCRRVDVGAATAAHPATTPPPRRTPSVAARRARRRGLLRLAAVLLALVATIGVSYLLLVSSLFEVRSIAVVGTTLLPDDDVRAAAALPAGQPMLRLDVDAVATRIAALPAVAEVHVERSWPSTVVLRITERAPVAFAPVPAGAQLIDRNGFGFATVPAAPPGLPQLRAAAGPPAQAAAAVLAVLDEPARQALRAELISLRAESPAAVELDLRGDRTVRWGSAADSLRKADVLTALLSQPGKVYDVISPDLPTIR